jgi:hypothetical protein
MLYLNSHRVALGLTRHVPLQAAARFAEEQSEILLPFFKLDEQAASLLSVEALELIVRFLFVLADDERKLVKVCQLIGLARVETLNLMQIDQNSQSVLAGYESALRSTAVRFLSREDVGSQFEPSNAEEHSQAETLQREPSLDLVTAMH